MVLRLYQLVINLIDKREFENMTIKTSQIFFNLHLIYNKLKNNLLTL